MRLKCNLDIFVVLKKRVLKIDDRQLKTISIFGMTKAYLFFASPFKNPIPKLINLLNAKIE